jgi:hypothetical protein
LHGTELGWALIIGKKKLDSGEKSIGGEKHFFFENQWLLEEDFEKVFVDN